MTGLVGGSGGGGITYVQTATPSAPSVGETWFDPSADGGNGEVYVWDGDSWNATGYVRHDQLTNVTADQHHTRYTDSEAQAAVSTFSGDHADLSGVGPSDHHSRYTDSEAAAQASDFQWTLVRSINLTDQASASHDFNGNYEEVMVRYYFYKPSGVNSYPSLAVNGNSLDIGNTYGDTRGVSGVLEAHQLGSQDVGVHVRTAGTGAGSDQKATVSGPINVVSFNGEGDGHSGVMRFYGRNY